MVGYEGLYEVSSVGRVRSLARRGTLGGVRRLRMRKDGYYDVELSCDNVKSKQLVHRLVAAAFHPNPEGHPVARHLNDVRVDNRAENLAWGSLSDNTADAIRNGRNPHLMMTHCRKGHPYDAENTNHAHGYRSCRECGRTASREHMRRVRATLKAAA